MWDASHYLVRQVFSGLKEMFTGTREIQVGYVKYRSSLYSYIKLYLITPLLAYIPAAISSAGGAAAPLAIEEEHLFLVLKKKM